MANALPPVKGAAFATEIALVATSDTDIFQAAPTLAAGDVVVVKDGVLDGNIDTLPTAVTSVTKLLTVALSTSEMNADRVTVIFSDASGGEWQDAMLTIFTAAQTFDTMQAKISSRASATTALSNVVWTGTRAGYLDVALSTIKAKTDLITTTAVTVASPVASGGDVTIFRGDSYKLADSRQIEWTIASDANVVGGTLQILLDGVATLTGSVPSAVLLRCQDLTSTQSGAIAEGPHGMQVRVIQADNDVLTKVIGTLTALDPQNQ